MYSATAKERKNGPGASRERARVPAIARALLALLLPALLRGTAAAAFADLGAGARAPGMGNAFVAVADDIYSVHYNPAGLALLERPEMAASYTRHLIGLSDGSDLGTSFLGYAYPLKAGQGTVAASWQQFSLDGGLYQEQITGISYGNALFRELGPGDLYGGINLKVLRRSFGSVPEADNALNGLTATGQADPVLSGKRSLNVPDMDLGFLYRLRRHYAAGLSLTHVTRPNVAFSKGESDTLPLGVKAAFNYRSLLSNAGVQYETRRSPVGVQDHRFTVAAERWLPWLFVGNVGARGALTIGNRDFKQATLGLSYRNARFGVDYGFSMPLNSIVSVSGTHRLSFFVRFGPVAEAEESVELILEAMRELKGGQAPRLEYRKEGLTPDNKKLLEEYLASVRALEAAARYQEALAVLTKALSLSPSDEGILKSFGRLNFVASMLRALPSYRTEPVSAAWHQGILAYLSYDDAAAVDMVSDALALAPASREIDSFLTQLEAASGLKRKAAGQASGAAAGRPADPAEALASAAVEEERYQEAIALSRQVLSRAPENLSALENLGISYFAVGELRGSLDAFEKARALEKNPARRALLNTHIEAVRNVMRNQRKTAVPAGSGAAGPDVQGLYNEGLDLYSSGQLEKARSVFERVLELNPRYVPAVKALKRVKEELRTR